MLLYTRSQGRPAWRPLGTVAVLLGLALVVGGCGSAVAAATSQTAVDRPAAESTSTSTTTSNSGTSSTTRATSGATGVTFFDSSVVHEMEVSFSLADYNAMIETYRTTGNKDWIEATVTIDGQTFENVGMRLKGNSSIMGLRGQGLPGGAGLNVTADNPEKLPWLIRLDKNVKGQNHGGIVDFVVRSNTSQTSLNEAVALELLGSAGLPTEKAVAVRFSVDEGEPVLRLVTELPDDRWMEDNLDASGALYKAESTGDYSYRGNDPSSYEQDFTQEAGKKNADLTPLIQFLDFINNSDDATFAAELPSHLDVDSFAIYLAMQDLLGNFDDIDGPGNNSYLYYDTSTGAFTVVPWDYNLAFRGLSRGGAGNGNAAAQGRGNVGVAGQGRGAGGGPRGGNILAERFRANADFKSRYLDQVTKLKSSLYESGVASGILARWVNLLETQASDLVDKATVEQEAAKIAQYFD